MMIADLDMNRAMLWIALRMRRVTSGRKESRMCCPFRNGRSKMTHSSRFLRESEYKSCEFDRPCSCDPVYKASSRGYRVSR